METAGHPSASGDPDRRGGIDAFDSLLVRQPIRGGDTDAVTGAIADWAGDNANGDARTLLPVEGVHLVTLFLDTGDFGWRGTADTRTDRRNALVWYVEVADDDAEQWVDPDRTIRESSPVFDSLGDLLAEEATVHADGRDGHQLITHAANPERQRRYADHVGTPLLAPVAGNDVPLPVVVTTIPLKPGLVSRIVSRAVDFGNWLKGFDWIQERLRTQTETLEEEAMYTESLLLEPVGDRLVLHYYMETEDMDRLYDAYDESENLEVRFSDWVMRRIFADPDQMLDPPLESDCEVLLHAVDPDRP